MVIVDVVICSTWIVDTHDDTWLSHQGAKDNSVR
jgi:hypothetical protein